MLDLVGTVGAKGDHRHGLQKAKDTASERKILGIFSDPAVRHNRFSTVRYQEIGSRLNIGSTTTPLARVEVDDFKFQVVSQASERLEVYDKVLLLLLTVPRLFPASAAPSQPKDRDDLH